MLSDEIGHALVLRGPETTTQMHSSNDVCSSENLTQVASSVRCIVFSHYFGCALHDNAAALFSTLWPQVNDPVRALDYFEVVLNHDNGVALFNKGVEHLQQPFDILEVQTGSRLVKHVNTGSSGTLGEFFGKFDALRFTP